MRIAICEDTAMEAEFLCELLRRYQQKTPHIRLELALFESAEALVQALQARQNYDLYLLDIIMPGMDGMSLARELRRREAECVIVFLTSSPDFALEAFSVKAFDYLVKPVEKERLFEAVDDAIATLGRRVEATATIQTPELDLTVKRGDIVAVEVTGHTLAYSLADGRRLVSKVLRIPFAEATAGLLEDPRFFSPHRSFLINLAHLQKLDKDCLQMAGGLLVPVSRLRYGQLKQCYAAYLEVTGAS